MGADKSPAAHWVADSDKRLHRRPVNASLTLRRPLCMRGRYLMLADPTHGFAQAPERTPQDAD